MIDVTVSGPFTTSGSGAPTSTSSQKRVAAPRIASAAYARRIRSISSAA